MNGSSQCLHVSILDILHFLFHPCLQLLISDHAHSELQHNRVHLTLDHHCSDQLANVVNSDQIVLQNVRRHSIVHLKTTNRFCVPDELFILNRADDQILDLVNLWEVVNLPVKWTIPCQKVANERLLGQSENLVPRRWDFWHNRSYRALLSMLEVIDIAHCIALECVAWDTHVQGEAHDLLFVNDELLLEAWLLVIWICRRLLCTDWHAVDVLLQLIVHEHFSWAESKQTRQVCLNLLDQWLERAMLDERWHETDGSIFHLHLMVALYVVREDLDASFDQLWENLAHREVIVIPDASQLVGAATDTEASIWHLWWACAANMFAFDAHSHGSSKGLSCCLFKVRLATYHWWNRR